MYELAKLVGWTTSPLSIAILLWGFTIWMTWIGQRRLALGVGVLGLGVLWMLAMPLVAHLLAHRLESEFPAVPTSQSPKADAILVLGGALSGASPPLRPSFDIGSAADRVWHAAALYRAGKARYVLVAGGNNPNVPGLDLEATAIREMLRGLGVPDAAIRSEGLSRNTIENAFESKALVRRVNAQRLLLVTSAMHMPRAMLLVQDATRDSGVTVVPASTDVEGLPNALHPVGRWLPDANALALSSRAWKEYLALFLLRTTGYG